MTTKQARSLWRTLQEQEAADDLEEIDAMSDTELDSYINENGGAAAGIRARGAALAAKLHAERAAETLTTPLAWEANAAARLDEVRKLAGTVRKTKLARADLLAKVDAARHDPRFKKPVGALFRKRTAADSTDEELEAILEAIELLAKIEE